jgi:hypothetical protein
MTKKSKKKYRAKQSYLPIVVLNNNVESTKKKVSSGKRKIVSSFTDSGNDKDTVVYIQNYPPHGVIFDERIDEPFERRAGSSGTGSSVKQYVARPDSYQVPVAAASSSYGGGGGGGCGYSSCGGGQDISLFEGLIFLGALAAAVYFLNNQVSGL